MEEVFTEAEVRQFLGYLSGKIPELHNVEVPRLAAAWEEFRDGPRVPSNGSAS